MNAIVAVTMPRWGLTMDEGLLTDWLAAPGTAVEKGAEIVEVESTKLAGTVESPASGILRRQIVEIGETVPCGTLLGIIADVSVSDEELDAFAEGFVVIDERESEDEAAGPQQVEVDGASISYVRKGSGTPILFIHGFGGDASGWAFVQEALAAKFDTIAPDLPGHGASGKVVADGSLAGQARSVIAFIEALGVESVNIVAHSMGGGIALAIAGERPDLVRAMLLLAPMGLGRDINTAYLDAFIAAEKHRDIGKVLQTLFADPALVSRQMTDEVQKYKRVDGVRAALGRVRSALAGDSGQAANLSDILRSFEGPVTILWGEDDQIIPAGQAEAVGAVLLPGVGHMPQAEAAPQVIEAALGIFEA